MTYRNDVIIRHVQELLVDASKKRINHQHKIVLHKTWGKGNGYIKKMKTEGEEEEEPEGREEVEEEENEEEEEYDGGGGGGGGGGEEEEEEVEGED